MFANRTLSNDPFVALRRMDQVFDQMLRGWALPEMRGKSAFPPLNVSERDDAYVVEAEVPGVRADDLDLEVRGKELTLKGRRAKPEGDDLTIRRRERGAGEFTRILELPVAVDSERVAASLRDGVLTVTLPKVASAIPKRIAVQS